MAYFAKNMVEYATFVVEKKEECYIGFHRKRAQRQRKKKGSFAMDLGEFYEKHRQYYYWKLNRKIRGMGLAFHAEDIIHDVVVNMIANEEHREKFEHLTEPEAKAYFMSCLTNRMIDVIRREKRCREYFELVEYDEKRREMMNCSVEHVVMKQMNMEYRMSSAFRLLSVEERELLRLVYVENLSYQEIAKRGSIRESAVAMRVFRLRKKILKICRERRILCGTPEDQSSWALEI